MPKSLPIFSSFSSGEITPRLASRSDVDAYKNGVNIMRNMIATSHGPAARRYGMEMVTWDDPASGRSRLVDARIFGFSITKSYGTFVFVGLAEDGTTSIAPYAPEGSILPPSVELVTNPRFEDGSTGWTDISVGTGQASFINGQCIMQSGTPNQPISYSDNWTTNDVGPPASGEVTIGVGQVDISKTSDASIDRSAGLLGLSNGDPLRLEEALEATRYNTYQVTGAATDNGTYVSVPVALVDSGNPIRNATLMTVNYTSTIPDINIGGVEQEVTGTVATNTTRLRLTGASNENVTPLRVTVGNTQGAADLVDTTILGRDLDVSFQPTGTSVWFRMWVDEGLSLIHI